MLRRDGGTSAKRWDRSRSILSPVDRGAYVGEVTLNFFEKIPLFQNSRRDSGSTRGSKSVLV
jgi:hypothetical protein